MHQTELQAVWHAAASELSGLSRKLRVALWARDEPMAPPAATSSAGARSVAPAAEGKATPEAVGPAMPSLW